MNTRFIALSLAAQSKAAKAIVADIQKNPQALDAIHSDGKTSLHRAVELNEAKLVKELIQLGSDINKKTETPATTVGATALQIAMKNNNAAIQEIIMNSLGEITYTDWLKAQLKLPTESSLSSYLQELQTNSLLKGAAKEAVQARKTWTDVVSASDIMNDSLEKAEGEGVFDEKMIDRLKKLGFTENTEVVYRDCISYLQNSQLVMSFPEVLFSGGSLTDYKPLNFFETGRSGGSDDDRYGGSRDRVERNLFKFLNADSYTKLFDDNKARPRYCSLQLLDRNHSIDRVKQQYGSSFIVFRDVVKLNSLFLPEDSMSGNYFPCTYLHFNLFLSQCIDSKLIAIANKVTKGQLTEGYSPHQVGGGGYIEALIPAINVFDKNLVEHIHIHRDEFHRHGLKPEEKSALQQMGIAVTNEGSTPYPRLTKDLLESMQKNDLQRVEALLQTFPSLRKSSTLLGQSILQFAESLGNKEMIALIKTEGRSSRNNTNIASLYDFTPLWIAAEDGSFEVFQRVMRTADTEEINQLNEKGHTALELAAKMGHLKIVEALIDAGATVDLTNKNGQTPFWVATEANQPAVAQALIKAGAKVDYPDKEGQTPLGIAIYNGYVEVLELIIKTLTKSGITVDLPGQFGLAPFWMAIKSDNPEIVQTLMKAGADVNQQAKSSLDTPLHWIAWNTTQKHFKNQIEIAKMIIDARANLNHPDREGYTPFARAALQENFELISVLAEAGANVNQPNNDGFLPLCTAVMNNRIEVVEALIKADVNVNLRLKNGRTPIEWAAARDNFKIASILIKAGAEVSERALELVKQSQNVELIKLLQNTGDTATTKIKYGKH